MKRTYSLDEARSIAASLQIDFAKAEFDLAQFHAGLNVEAEHGEVDPTTNVTDDDPLTTGKIALAHLHEMPRYYTSLQQMEAEAEAPKTPEMISRAPEDNSQPWAPKEVLIGLGLLVLGVLFLRFRKRTKAG